MASKKRLAKFEEAAVVELGNLSLAKVDFFDLFGLKHDFSPKPSCNGPSLSQWAYLIREDGEQKETGKKKKKTPPRHIQELKRSLDSRYYHLVESPKVDGQRLRCLNNAHEYFKADCAIRFRGWATNSTRTEGSTNWSQCCNRSCSRITPTQEDSMEREAVLEPLSKPGEPGGKADALADDVIIISSDDSFQAETSHESNLGEKPLLCLCQGSFQDVQSLLDHGRLCEEVPESARAKGDRVRQNECVYDCVMKDRTKRSWKHRNRTHYACQNCGEIATQRSGHHFSSPKPIDPVGYFLQPKKEFQKQRPGQVIEKAFKSMSPCEAKDLGELDDAQLVSIFRSRLKQRAALAFASSDSPVVMNEGLGSHQGAPDTILDPGNETENRNNPVPFLESNARASPIQQAPWSAADSPAVAQSDCTIFEQVESVDRTPASSAVEPPSPSFSLPGDGQVNLDSGPASPPEDDAQDPSFGLSRCEDVRSQRFYSRNDSLTNGSDASPDQARPDTISNVEPLPSYVAVRTTADHSPTIETDERRPYKNVTEDNDDAMSISKSSGSVSTPQQDPLSAVDCPTPTKSNYTLPKQTEGGSSTVENPSTASPSPPTSLTGYDIDMTLCLPSPQADDSHNISEPPDCEDGYSPRANSGISTGLGMPLSGEPSVVDSGVESSRADITMTVSQVSPTSIPKGTATLRKRSIGNKCTESPGTKAKKVRLVQGSPADGRASIMGVAQGDEAGDDPIIAPSLRSSESTHRHAPECNITRALEIAADCPTDHTLAENTGQASGTVAQGTEVSTFGPFTTVPSAWNTEPSSTNQLSTNRSQAIMISQLVNRGQAIGAFGNSLPVEKDDTPTNGNALPNHNIPDEKYIETSVKIICSVHKLKPSVPGRYHNNTIIWRIDSQKGLDELKKNRRLLYDDAILVEAQGYSCLTFYPKDISKFVDYAKDVAQDDPFHVPPIPDVLSIDAEQCLSRIGTPSCTVKERATLTIWSNGYKFLTYILDDQKGGGLPALPSCRWVVTT